MATEKSSSLTSEADRILDKAVNEYRAKILEDARQGKFIPGEDVIEVTASDVLRAIQGRPSEFAMERLERRNALFRLLGFTYAALGSLLSLGAIFWEPILALFKSNEITAKLLAGGLLMIIFGVAMVAFARYRQIRITSQVYVQQRWHSESADSK